ncbi:MAG TPA: S8 family serine peptidase, partial [Pyrinomonadaceae bacterium]|nr:S8 family serine peptidase [Pyrinomonadaceae bacterium]
MYKRIPLQILAFLLALGLFAYLANRTGNVTHAQSDDFDRAQYANDTPIGDLQDQLPDTGEVDVIIELQDEATTRVYARVLRNQNDRAAAQGAARAQMAKIRGAQQRVLAHLAAAGRNARVLYSVQTAYNGIAAKIDASILSELRANPDVKAVHRLPIHYIDNSTSAPFIKAPSAWQATSGNSGQGIRIAIIDTGVDYTHANFGGPGTVAAYTGNNRAIIEPGTFPTAKVVAGRDFAGDAYTGANTPVPDGDPLDCNGHGSHVAGTAGGLGVNADGTTFVGPYDNTTPFSSFLIGPGVAPRADIYALKIFG